MWEPFQAHASLSYLHSHLAPLVSSGVGSLWSSWLQGGVPHRTGQGSGELRLSGATHLDQGLQKEPPTPCSPNQKAHHGRQSSLA